MATPASLRVLLPDKTKGGPQPSGKQCNTNVIEENSQ
jgi:hypothetical protein